MSDVRTGDGTIQPEAGRRLRAERDAYRRRLDIAEVAAGKIAQERDEARATIRRVRSAANELLRREMQHAGHGRDGHLNEDDIAVVFEAIEPREPTDG